LTRSGFSGVQRYAALWTGDNVATDEHMLGGVRIINALGLVGMAFAGSDIGGFAGEASPALFARWISLGMFSPLARGHSAVNTRSAEPWAFGEATEAVAGVYIRLRYRLLPYLYSVFFESAESGMPVARSLAVDFPHDDRIYAPHYDGQYLFGPAILVVPVPSGPVLAKAYLPAGLWYDFYTDQPFTGPAEIVIEAPAERLPLFVRAGSVLPMQAEVLHTRQRPPSILDLHVYAGDKGRGFTYYEDDGETLAYREGDFFKRRIGCWPDRLVIGAAQGRFVSRFDQYRICFHGGGAPERVRVEGCPVATEAVTLRFGDPGEGATTGGFPADFFGVLRLPSVTLPNRRHRIVVDLW
jgi:alpha-glucosidase